MTAAFPLAWPDGWPRTPAARQGASRFRTTFDKARKHLYDELRQLGARNVVLSSNVPLRLDGHPRSDWARSRIDDPGIAVYFTLRDRQMVIAHDRYWSVGENLHAIGHAIAHLRGLDRHGGAPMMERAFSGFAALPPPAAVRPWREVFDFVTSGPITAANVEAAYRRLARERHPDVGGSADAMAELNAARDEALREIGG